MRIIRTTGKVEELFYVSSNPDLDKSLLFPKVPDNFLTRGKFQEWQIPRFRLYKSVGDAISGLYLGQEMKGAKLYVYRPLAVNNEHLIETSITTVPYALVLDELWYTGKIRFKKIAEIEVGDKLETKTYRYGPRSTKANLFVWDWREYLKYKNMRSNYKLFSSADEDHEEKIKKFKELGTATALVGSGAAGLATAKKTDERLEEAAKNKINEVNSKFDKKILKRKIETKVVSDGLEKREAVKRGIFGGSLKKSEIESAVASKNRVLEEVLADDINRLNQKRKYQIEKLNKNLKRNKVASRVLAGGAIAGGTSIIAKEAIKQVKKKKQNK